MSRLLRTSLLFLLFFTILNIFLSIFVVRKDDVTTRTKDSNENNNNWTQRQESLIDINKGRPSSSSSLRIPYPKLDSTKSAAVLLNQHLVVHGLIDSAIRQSTKTPILFFLCLDHICQAEAIRYISTTSIYSKSLCAIQYVLPFTFLGENYFFTNILSNLIRLQDESDRWIGTIPWYGGSSSYNLTSLEKAFFGTNTVDDTIDLILFRDTKNIASANLTFLNQNCCPGIKDLLIYILENIGESQDDILIFQSSFLDSKIMIQSGFMSRSRYIETFTSWLSQALLFLNTDALAQQRVWNASCISSLANNPLLIADTDTPFIPLYPFIGNLLTTYFFNTRKLKAITFTTDASSSRGNLSPKQHTDVESCPIDTITNSLLFSRPIAQINAIQSVNPPFRDTNESTAEYISKVKSNISKKYNPSDSSIVFILWDDYQNEASVLDKFSNNLWAQPLHIPSTYFKESYFYTNILGSILDLSGLTSSWVGSIRYDVDIPFDLTVVNSILCDEKLLESDVEVISFYDPLGAGESIETQAEFAHPGLMNLLVHALESVGEIKVGRKLQMTSPDFKGIFGYSFVARPKILHEFVLWMARVNLFITADVKAQEMVWKDSRHQGSQAQLDDIFGSPFYPLHPFFGERLVSYFFNTRGYKIITLNEYTATRNGKKASE